MPAPLPSISRREVGSLLDVPDDVIDSLIHSGKLLCHVRGGDTRVPLDQLEAFFRDALVRVIRASAIANVEPATPPLRVERRDHEEPDEARDDDSAPTDAPPQPEPAPLAITPAVEKPVERRNSRLAPRFIPRRQIDGIFKDVRFTIVQISATGLRIRHNEPLLPGDEAKLTFALLNPPQSFLVRARVVWTSVARYENDESNTFCISGLRVTAHQERVQNAIEILQQHRALQPDASEPNAESPTPSGVSDDEVALVMKAVQRFAADPSEATRWYSRGRFALADEEVRRSAPPRPRDREQVLGIWEYLERQVEIPKIAGVLTWMEKSTGARPWPQ